MRNTSKYKVLKYVSTKYQTIYYKQQKTPKVKLLKGERKKPWAKISHADKRKQGVAILISGKINFKAKALDKTECHFR